VVPVIMYYIVPRQKGLAGILPGDFMLVNLLPYWFGDSGRFIDSIRRKDDCERLFEVFGNDSCTMHIVHGYSIRNTVRRKTVK
jgi:hypothetical protein